MGLLARLASIWQLAKAIPQGYFVTSWQNKRPYLPTDDYKLLVKKYQSYVYACVQINANACAKVPLRLYAAKPKTKTKTLFATYPIDRKTKSYLLDNPIYRRKALQAEDIEEVLEHPFLELMKNVNPFMNQFDLMESLFSFQDLTGNAYWYYEFNELGVPQEIWPLYPQFIKIVPDAKKFISHYEYALINSVDKKIIKPKNLVHFKMFSPHNYYYGMGPLRAAVVAADLSYNMNVYETALMQNGAVPEWVLKLPVEAGEPEQATINRMDKEWRAKHGKIKKRGGMKILTGGAELQQVSLSPKEISFLKGRKEVLNEIATIFGVPMALVTSDNVNKANAEIGKRQHKEDTVQPRLRRAEQKINEQLLPLYDENLFCAFDNPVPEDKEFRLKEIENHLKNGYASVNQERQIDGQDDVEWGEVPLMPVNIVPLGTVVLEVEPEKPKHIDKVNKDAHRLPPAQQPTNFTNPIFIRDIQRYYRRQEEAVLTKFDEDTKLKPILDTGKAIKLIADDIVAGWLDVQAWANELSKVNGVHLRYALLGGAETAMKRLMTDRLFDSMTPKISIALERHRLGMIQTVNSNAQALRRTIAEGIEAGEGSGLLRNRITSLYDGFEKYNAERIARTETIWAYNEGAKQGYVQSGVVTRMVWVSSGDDRTCAFCPELDGKTVDIIVDESFFEKGGTFINSEGKELKFEYEDIGHPPLHPMCRCAVSPIVEGV